MSCCHTLRYDKLSNYKETDGCRLHLHPKYASYKYCILYEAYRFVDKIYEYLFLSKIIKTTNTCLSKYFKKKCDH